MSSLGAFRLLTLMTALVGVLAYCVADSKPTLAMLALAAAIGSLLISRLGPGRALPRLAINLLVLGATLNVLLRVLAARDALVSDLTDFLVFILLVKMFDRARIRDEAQLLGLSVFVVIGAMLTSNALLLGLLLLIYTPMVIASFVGFQIALGVARSLESPDPAVRAALPATLRDQPSRLAMVPGRAARRDLVLTTTAAVALSMLLGVVGFLITPRTLAQQALDAFGGVRLGSQTDFRDEITLGGSGTISTSEEPVMDVELYDDRGQPLLTGGRTLYLRGAVLDEYVPATGQWRSSVIAGHRGSGRVQPGPERTLGPDTPTVLGEAPRGRATVTQQITLRAASPGTPLFAEWRPVSAGSPALTRVFYQPREGLLHHAGSGGRLTYTVVSAPEFIEPDVTPAMPPLFREGPVRALAARLLGEAGVSVDRAARQPADNRRAINAMIDYLRASAVYSLDQSIPAPGQDPIEMFLFDPERGGRGHCEYFASALAALLRSVEIDARVVTGYAAGEYNAIAGHYVVRKADAHAWVEARTRPDRWETFDPTPPGELGHAQRRGSGVLASLRQLYEALEFRWVDSVVAFDQGRRLDLLGIANDRRETFGTLRARLSALGDTASAMFPGLGRVPSLIILGLGTAGFLTGLVLVVRPMLRTWQTRRARQRAWRALAGAGGRAAPFYADLLAALDRAGLAKPDHLPPERHAQTFAESHPEASAVAREITRVFYAVRFGGAALDDEQARHVRTLLTRVESILRHVRTGAAAPAISGARAGADADNAPAPSA